MPGPGDPTGDGENPNATTPDRVARQLSAVATWLNASATFWIDVEVMGQLSDRNRFQPATAKPESGGAIENLNGWGHYDLAPDEALVIDVRPADARYWSVHLGNFWWSPSTTATATPASTGSRSSSTPTAGSGPLSPTGTRGWRTGWTPAGTGAAPCSSADRGRPCAGTRLHGGPVRPDPGPSSRHDPDGLAGRAPRGHRPATGRGAAALLPLSGGEGAPRQQPVRRWSAYAAGHPD